MKRYILLILVILVAMQCLGQGYPDVKDPTLLMPVSWQQNSAEYRALCYQAYNVATFRLEQMLARPAELTDRQQKPAVVVDIDETVLDNSPYNGEDALNGTIYPDDFAIWNQAAKATAVPGAIDFLKYADERGCAIFYVSNRNDSYKEGTKRNLDILGFPQVDDEHVMLRAGRDTKEKRRERIQENHDILLLVGDNLSDFEQVFKTADSSADRLRMTDDWRQEFGNRFIVLPNAMSGTWLKHVLDFKRNLPVEEKIRRLKDSIEGFEKE